MITEQYVRRSFPVDAVRVTAENMNDVATWCEGTVQTEIQDNKPGEVTFIKVRVQNPLTERQTKAFVGDWVLYAGKGYKVYTDKAFRKTFDEKVERRVPMPTGLTASVVADENGHIPENVFSGPSSSVSGVNVGSAGANPGGTTSV